MSIIRSTGIVWTDHTGIIPEDTLITIVTWYDEDMDRFTASVAEECDGTVDMVHTTGDYWSEIDALNAAETWILTRYAMSATDYAITYRRNGVIFKKDAYHGTRGQMLDLVSDSMVGPHEMATVQGDDGSIYELFKQDELRDVPAEVFVLRSPDMGF